MIKRLEQSRNKKAYRHKGTRSTSIKTVFGEVEYERTVYQPVNEEGKTEWIYLLERNPGAYISMQGKARPGKKRRQRSILINKLGIKSSSFTWFGFSSFASIKLELFFISK